MGAQEPASGDTFPRYSINEEKVWSSLCFLNSMFQVHSVSGCLLSTRGVVSLPQPCMPSYSEMSPTMVVSSCIFFPEICACTNKSMLFADHTRKQNLKHKVIKKIVSALLASVTVICLKCRLCILAALQVYLVVEKTVY